jgi:inner membrane protein
LVALCCLALLDFAGSFGRWPILLEGPRDEASHLLTAWIILAAVLPWRGRFGVWALVGSVVIDLDHIPLYVWGIGASTDGGRPVTHSLGTVFVLLALAGSTRRLRSPLLGLGLGVALHLVRDVATGPGVPLLWPVNSVNVLVPYPFYGVLLALGTAGAALRLAGASRARQTTAV